MAVIERIWPKTVEDLRLLRLTLARPGLAVWLLQDPRGLCVCWLDPDGEPDPSVDPPFDPSAVRPPPGGPMRDFWINRSDPELVELMRRSLEADGYRNVPAWRQPEPGEYTQLRGRYQVRFRWYAANGNGAPGDSGRRDVLAQRVEPPVQDEDGPARGGEAARGV